MVADLTLVSAASVKGPFAIDLPLTGPSGVEDRSGGPNKKYTVVMTFDQNIVVSREREFDLRQRAEHRDRQLRSAQGEHQPG